MTAMTREARGLQHSLALVDGNGEDNDDDDNEDDKD